MNLQENKVMIGKNVLNGGFAILYPNVESQLKQILGKNYVRVAYVQQNDSVIFGVNGQVKKTRQFVYDFLTSLQSCELKGYFFYRIYQSRFRSLENIAKVQFTQLQRIELIDCGITNIQPITWLNAPNLQSIYLGKNYITSLKALQKTNFKNLSSIDLGLCWKISDYNQFCQSAALCRMRTVKFDKKINNKLFVYISQNLVNIGNLNYICKMQNLQTSMIGKKVNDEQKKYVKQIKTINVIAKLQKL